MGGSQEVDLEPHFVKRKRNELAVKSVSPLRGVFDFPKEWGLGRIVVQSWFSCQEKNNFLILSTTENDQYDKKIFSEEADTCERKMKTLGLSIRVP
jgi:hypothetical protein